QAQLAECRSHGHAEDQTCPRCLAPLQKAAALYQDDFMAGFSLRDTAGFDDWQFFETDRLRREFAAVLERLVAIQETQDDFSSAIEDARRWLNLDPLNETAHRALITLYAKSDQRNAALRQYRQCVRILDQELGVPPLEETTHLYEVVKENRLEKQVDGDSYLANISPAVNPQVSDQGSLVVDLPLLVGRTTEWETLAGLYGMIRKDGVFAALTGEAGIGKTLLAQDFLTHLKNRGAITLSARAYEGESNLAYGPIVDLLRQAIHQDMEQEWWQNLNPRWMNETALLIPEVYGLVPNLVPLQPSDGPGAQSRFYEGICQTLVALVAGSTPGAILLDNLEWADESTLDLLAYLVRRLQGRPVFLLSAWRVDERLVESRLEQILTDAVQQGYGVHLPLESLSLQGSHQLIERYEPADQPFPPAFKAQLVAESGGLPYFLVEYLQAALAGEISTTLDAGKLPLPAGLRGMLQTRLASLSAASLQILQAAAVIGRTFESDLLQSTSGRTEDEIIQGIEDLLARGLIREIPVQSTFSRSATNFDFKYDSVRALVLEEISLIRLRLLHRRVAEALSEYIRFDPPYALDGQIAYHFQQAGLLDQAAEKYFKAGQAARTVHANTDALSHFQTALALGYPQKSQVMVDLGDLYMLQGDYPQAIQQYEAAAAFSAADLLPAIEQKIGHVYLRRGLWEQAACHFEAALFDLAALPPEHQKSFEAEIRSDWSLACYREGKMDQSIFLAQKALAMAELSGAPLPLAQVHNLLGVLARADQKTKLALKHLSKSLDFARKLENPSAQIAALNNLALAQADRGDYPLAIATLQDALKACLTLGDRHLEAALRNNLADTLRADGQEESAMVQLKQAVAIFADIGQNVEDLEPEIWKLVEW
ncbi:MAG: AAA family ATPase, partial [Anaerolineales bacterium]